MTLLPCETWYWKYTEPVFLGDSHSYFLLNNSCYSLWRGSCPNLLGALTSRIVWVQFQKRYYMRKISRSMSCSSAKSTYILVQFRRIIFLQPAMCENKDVWSMSLKNLSCVYRMRDLKILIFILLSLRLI